MGDNMWYTRGLGRQVVEDIYWAGLGGLGYEGN